MDDDEDWDADFGLLPTDEEPSNDSKQPPRVFGITASSKENWDDDDDFAFDDGESSDIFAAKRGLESLPNALKKLEETPSTTDDKDESTKGDMTEDEDWDADFDSDIKEKPALPKLSLPKLSSTQSQTPEDESSGLGNLPAKYRLLGDSNQVQVIKFPKPTLLYSMREKEGHRLHSLEKDFIDWLKKLLKRRNTESTDLTRSSGSNMSSTVEKWSKEWAENRLALVDQLWRAKNTSAMWNEITSHFNELDLLLQSPPINPQIISVLIEMNVTLLFFACKILTNEDELKIKSIIETCKAIDKSHSNQFDIAFIEALAHICDESKATSVLVQFENIFMKLQNQSKQQQQDGDGNGDDDEQQQITNRRLKAQILVDVQLFFSGYSPLTTEHRDLESDYFDELRSFRRSRSTADTLLNTAWRMATMTEIYHTLEPSFVKAKCAFAMGNYALSINEYDTAEKLYFEAIYVLDLCPTIIRTFVPIVSELGCSCLHRYAEVLQHNYKYKYSIQVYHTCALCYRLRGHQSDYYKIMRTMATLASDNDDHKLAINFYWEILRKYIEDRKINEMVYVVDVLSKIYVNTGQIELAEELLFNAFAMTNSNSISDARSFDLLLKLANVYLSGFFPDRGLRLLQLLQKKCPDSKKRLLLETLVKAHMRRFPGRNHSKLIAKLDEEMSRSKTLTSSMKSAQFFELKAVYLYQQHEFVEAICLIDFVIGGSSAKNLIGLGKNFYFRGKCLQAMISHAVTLPITLKSNDLSLSQSQQSNESVTFSDKGQVLQECIASFRKAYHYFGSVGDELRVAQTLSHIAKAFLDHLFFPVAFMRVPFSLLSRFEEFTVSSVVQPAERKEDKRKVKEALIEPKEFVISLKNIEAPANLALDIASEIVNPILMLNCYLNMAEIRILQGEVAAALSFWNECRSFLVDLLIGPVIETLAPIGLLKKIHKLAKRALRILFCFDTEIINCNLNFIDSFNLLQISLHQAKQSPIPLTITDETLQKLVQDIHTHTNRATISVSFSTSGMVPNSAESIRRMFSQPNGRVTSSEDLRELRNTLHSITVDSLHDSCISDTAQSIWNFMHVIKMNASEGKQTKDEMCEQNRRLLQRWATLCRMSARHSIGNFSSLIDEHPRLYRSVFLVDLTEYMISYVPATGERRAKRFGSKKQQTDEGLRKLNVKVVLMSNADEWGSFTVREDVTLKTFLSFALDVVILPSPEPTSNLKKPKKHFDSINRAIGKVLRLPIKFLESSKNFCTEVTALQARVSHFDLTSNMLGVAAPRLAFCAQLSSDDSSLLPLTGSMDKTFAQCFASVDNPTNSEPLILYLYETSQQPPVIELVPSSRSLTGDRGLQINEDEAAYMSRLIIGGKEDDLLNKRIIDEMSNTTFSWLIDILPTKLTQSPKHRKRIDADFPFLDPTSGAGSLFPVTTSPLILICGGSLHAFPWELLLGDVVLRYFTISHAFNHESNLKSTKSVTSSPHFVCFGVEMSEKQLQAEEPRRKSLVAQLFKHLQVSTTKSEESNDVQQPSSPFQSPLIKYKRKYKFLTLVESLAAFKVDKSHSNEFIVYLLTFADLIELEPHIVTLIRQSSPHTLVFVPAHKMRSVFRRIVKCQERYAKETSRFGGELVANRFQYLMALLQAVQQELCIPIAVINAP